MTTRLVVAAMLLVAACGDKDDTGADRGGPCADAPERVTWESFGRAFVTQNCQSCHASSVEGDDRNDAPDDVVFDTEDDVWAHADAVLLRAGGESPTMPPQGGVSEDDRYLLEVWLGCDG